MTIHHGGNFLQDNLKEEKLNDFSPKVGLKWPNREKQFKEFKSFDVETKFSIFCYKLSQCTSSPMKFMLLHSGLAACCLFSTIIVWKVSLCQMSSAATHGVTKILISITKVQKATENHFSISALNPMKCTTVLLLYNCGVN